MEKFNKYISGYNWAVKNNVKQEVIEYFKTRLLDLVETEDELKYINEMIKENGI